MHAVALHFHSCPDSRRAAPPLILFPLNWLDAAFCSRRSGPSAVTQIIVCYLRLQDLLFLHSFNAHVLINHNIFYFSPLTSGCQCNFIVLLFRSSKNDNEEPPIWPGTSLSQSTKTAESKATDLAHSAPRPHIMPSTHTCCMTGNSAWP